MVALPSVAIGSAVGIGIGTLIGYHAGLLAETSLQRQQHGPIAMKEGFFTAIEDHTDIDKDSDEAERRWLQSIAKREVDNEQ